MKAVMLVGALAVAGGLALWTAEQRAGHDILISAAVARPLPGGEMAALLAIDRVEALELAARTEGLILDPVYSGKAMAGLIGLIRKGEFKAGENVCFLHTGGSAAVFGYGHLFAANGWS